MRERVSILPTSTYLSKMHDAGWTLIALEWEREVETSSAPEPEQLPAASEEIPFGLRIGADCRHLEDDPLEMQTLSSPDRCRPAPPCRRRVGIPQETIVPRHLELLTRPLTWGLRGQALSRSRWHFQRSHNRQGWTCMHKCAYT